MKLVLIVFATGILSTFAMMSDSWVIYGWLHYLCGSLVACSLVKDYYKKEGHIDD